MYPLITCIISFQGQHSPANFESLNLLSVQESSGLITHRQAFFMPRHDRLLSFMSVEYLWRNAKMHSGIACGLRRGRFELAPSSWPPIAFGRRRGCVEKILSQQPVICLSLNYDTFRSWAFVIVWRVRRCDDRYHNVDLCSKGQRILWQNLHSLTTIKISPLAGHQRRKVATCPGWAGCLLVPKAWWRART